MIETLGYWFAGVIAGIFAGGLFLGILVVVYASVMTVVDRLRGVKHVATEQCVTMRRRRRPIEPAVGDFTSDIEAELVTAQEEHAALDHANGLITEPVRGHCMKCDADVNQREKAMNLARREGLLREVPVQLDPTVRCTHPPLKTVTYRSRDGVFRYCGACGRDIGWPLDCDHSEVSELFTLNGEVTQRICVKCGVHC